MPRGVATVAALGSAVVACLWQGLRASSVGCMAASQDVDSRFQGDELSLLQFASKSAPGNTAEVDHDSTKVTADEDEWEMLGGEGGPGGAVGKEREDREALEAPRLRVVGQTRPKINNNTVSAPKLTTRCPSTMTTVTMTSVTTTSTYKPLPEGVLMAFHTSNVTNQSEGYDVCFDPMLDDQRGFTLDLFIGSFPDPFTSHAYDGTIIASKIFHDPDRGDLGNVGWALLYYKQAEGYDFPFLEFQISSGGALSTTRQYLPAITGGTARATRVSVSYNGPHYKRVRIYVNKAEEVQPPQQFPPSWISSLSPQDLEEEMIPATTACMSIQKLSPQQRVHSIEEGFTPEKLPFSKPYQGKVGGVTFYQGQVTMKHLRDHDYVL